LFSGSPVATSLCEGEAVKKHVAVLSIYKKNFRVTPLPLKTVRPFVFDTIVLADCTIELSTEKPSEEVSWYSSGDGILFDNQMQDVTESLECGKVFGLKVDEHKQMKCMQYFGGETFWNMGG
jgi:hypothetical protein